ncbi:hypothetical protein HYN59_04570 [Flavobacterium album]|uniref:Uncharacterized protein n=1 Tax=Flavobacterium album TaxID=2175091 RepID=A0A2S1QVL5_9FLAO|nr:hypothetical protein [Flavobacterium album]AWH84434.1 hypothetical protein HYN59_04570 [Flavobacterium album]
MKTFFLLIITLCFAANSYCQASNDNYILSIKKGKEVIERGKVFWVIPVTLTNSSKDTLKYYSMSCSWQDFYDVDNLNLHVEEVPCDKNVPEILQLAPGKRKNVILRLEFTGNSSKINFRVGLNLIHYSGKWMHGWDLPHSPKNMIWSNQIRMEREKE